MASSIDFVNYILEQVHGAGSITYRKMFGEYLIYCNNKPVILLCDDTPYVKILQPVTEFLGEDNPTGYPYEGAKLHYIADADDKERLVELVGLLEQIIPLPKKKR